MKVSEMFKLLEQMKDQERQNAFVAKKLRAAKKVREKKDLEETLMQEVQSEPAQIPVQEEVRSLEYKVDTTIPAQVEQPYVNTSNQEATYKIFPSEVQYATQRQTNFSDLTNTFIKEGLLSEGQPLSPDQRDAIMNRLQSLMPGADPVKILSYVSGVSQGAGKKEGVERRKIE